MGSIPFAVQNAVGVTAAALVVGLLGYVIYQSRQLAACARQLLTLQHDRAEALDRADEARRSAEDASHLKDEFLAAASHELRTPLNAIVGWVQVLKTGVLPAGQQQHALEAIERNTRIQTRLIEDLLDVSRMVHGRLTLTTTPVDLRPIVDKAIDAARPAATAKRIGITVRRDDREVMVMGDADRLQQVAWSVISNAVKYTPGDGQVAIAVKNLDGLAEIRVRDSGAGIAPEFLQKVFDPFSQSNPSAIHSGLGLGLSIAKRLVDLHGGEITASSQGKGHGSEFVISLPKASPLELAAAQKANPASSLTGLRVLLAEDDVDSAAALKVILQLRGCEARTAHSAAECMKIINEWPAQVFLCDVGLPDDDGYNLLKRVRATPRGAQLPAIAVTALTRDEDRARALAAGFRAHVSKPFEVDLLLEEISAAVGSPQETPLVH